MKDLCPVKSQFHKTKLVEGALVSSHSDVDINCTITFRAKSAQQHFVIRFEELKLGCGDHLEMFDGDVVYGQQNIKDFSCRDNMASVPIIKTTSTFLTMRYSSDGKAKFGDGFRLVLTAVFDITMADCPRDYNLCRNHLCISRSLFCDGTNHCLDNSDEIGCNYGTNEQSGYDGLPFELGLFVVLVLFIVICVIVCLGMVVCRRESPYAQYQHHLQRIGVPLQTSSSLMFTSHHQPQYTYFQPANLSPYVTPQHHALATTTTLPRGYSTLPLNLVRGPGQRQPQTILAKANNIPDNNEYLMMTGLTGHNPQTATAIQQATPQTMQTNLFLPTSQSILPASSIRYTTQAPQE